MSASREIDPPDVMVEDGQNAPTPARVIRSDNVRQIGDKLTHLFTQYRADRRVAELKWLRNLRQYLGIYDPDIEKTMSANRSKAYPRITRVKCISVLSRIMNLMFPGNERNWELRASPSPDMSPEDVMEAVQELVKKQQEAGLQPEITDETVQQAVQALASKRAAKLMTQIDDQLQEIGGDQTKDYVALNRAVVKSGILYGLGVLRGPFVRTVTRTTWAMNPMSQMPEPQTTTAYKPQFDFLPIWDFYPDMSAKTLAQGDGYFMRFVMSRSQVRQLMDRQDFFPHIIREYLNRTPTGNFKADNFETELRAMGVKTNVNEQKTETQKYEVIVWNGPLSGEFLAMAGVDVPADQHADDIEAEVWMIDNTVIKCAMNPWRKMGSDVKTIHPFLFDEDDTSPVGDGLPNVIRDSQMSICAAARMLLDNASIVCGPNLEINTDLMRADQDLTGTYAYKIWYREGTGQDAMQPAVRNVQIDSHMAELTKIVEMYMQFADAETFVGPATGGDMQKGFSEPLRTAAGASMLRGDAALPFKDIVRNFDGFTQSVICSLVEFNKRFNPGKAQAGDYDVIARGATSLIAKEIRGQQVDTLATTLSPEERIHVDERKLVEQRFLTRDLGDMLVDEGEAKRRRDAQQQQMQKQMDQQTELTAATIRKTLADAFKNVAQGQKNSANADAVAVKAALDLMSEGMDDTEGTTPAASSGGAPRAAKAA